MSLTALACVFMVYMLKLVVLPSPCCLPCGGWAGEVLIMLVDRSYANSTI